MKIMLVEDDAAIRNTLAEVLEKWNYEIVKLEVFDQVFEEFVKEAPQLLLLDINLPSFDGFYWCNKIREISNIPIIFVSSRNTPMDMVMAMNMGGDDFVQKPFDTNVLLAKINALLRRSYSYTDTEANVLQHDGVVLHIKDWHISCEGKQLNLTKTEFIILSILMQNQGSIVSRNKLMRKLWKDESFVDDNTLSVNVNRLRRKLEDLGREGFITTKKGEGYIII